VTIEVTRTEGGPSSTPCELRPGTRRGWQAVMCFHCCRPCADIGEYDTGGRATEILYVARSVASQWNHQRTLAT
jgi:hypothetical protein